MARLPRFFAPDAPLHVIQRGNDRRTIFEVDEDRRFYLHLLTAAARKHGVALHAYVLMSNHVHLLATPARAESVPRMMQSIGRIYVQRFNTRNRRTGTLWEGRYKAAIVDDQAYLLACMRYIELNPVRAGLAAEPRDYAWSSHGANALGAPSFPLTPHPAYLALGEGDEARRAAYRRQFEAGLPEAFLESIRDATQHAWAMGGDAFLRRVESTGRRAGRRAGGRPVEAAGRFEDETRV